MTELLTFSLQGRFFWDPNLATTVSNMLLFLFNQTRLTKFDYLHIVFYQSLERF